MSASEVKAAKITAPKVGSTYAVTVTTLSADLDISTLTEILGGELCGFLPTVATQVCFDNAAVTIDATVPAFPANVVFYAVIPGTHIGVKGSGAGTLYIWNANSVGGA